MTASKENTDSNTVHRLLVTVLDHADLVEFHLAVGAFCNRIETRGSTTFYTALDDGLAAAIETAKEMKRITLERVTLDGGSESYALVFKGSAPRWEPGDPADHSRNSKARLLHEWTSADTSFRLVEESDSGWIEVQCFFNEEWVPTAPQDGLQQFAHYLKNPDIVGSALLVAGVAIRHQMQMRGPDEGWKARCSALLDEANAEVKEKVGPHASVRSWLECLLVGVAEALNGRSPVSKREDVN